MYAIDYRRPQSVVDAASTLEELAGSKILAGGQTLVPTMKNRLARPQALVDLGAIAELRTIETRGTELRIGAMSTHAAVADSQIVRSSLPGLAALAEGIGDPHVRHRGTIGGSVANNDPAADYPAALLALRAVVETNRRAIPADDFFQGLFTTALDETEIVTAIRFPLRADFTYQKFRNPASRYALVGVAVARQNRDVRVVVTGAGQSGVFRVPAMEQALTASFTTAAVAGVTVEADDLNTDMHGTAAYRCHLISVIAKRAVDDLSRHSSPPRR